MAKYRLTELVTFLNWRTISDSLTGTSHVEKALTCNRWYYYRISAYGDGVAYAAKWGPHAETWLLLKC